MVTDMFPEKRVEGAYTAETLNLVEYVESNNGLNWIHHVGKMEPEHIPKQLMDYTPRGTRSIGRPKSRWKDQPIQ
jgi:hypothetical protein